jgi:hypothetical protein
MNGRQLRYQILMAASMKMTVCWNVVARSLVKTDISEVFAASIIRAMSNTEKCWLISTRLYSATFQNIFRRHAETEL